MGQRGPGDRHDGLRKVEISLPLPKESLCLVLGKSSPVPSWGRGREPPPGYAVPSFPDRVPRLPCCLLSSPSPGPASPESPEKDVTVEPSARYDLREAAVPRQCPGRPRPGLGGSRCPLTRPEAQMLGSADLDDMSVSDTSQGCPACRDLGEAQCTPLPRAEPPLRYPCLLECGQ